MWFVVYYLIAVAAASRVDPCDDSLLAATPICDRTLPLEQRAQGLINVMTLKEKVLQMGNTAPAVDRLGLPAYQWWNEALHGILHNCIDNHCPTTYPAPLALAATFNLDLVEKVAEQISTEARAVHIFSDGVYGLQVWAPNINIYKDPRWGRGQETPGECVYLTSQYAIRYIRGMQGANDTSDYPKLFATVKHFAVYNEETRREHFDAIVSDRDLRQTYLPAFEASIVEGGAGSLMCSYNSVNGVPACANDFLLNTTLRNDWKFDGFIVSDCDAVSDISHSHHFVNTSAEGAAAALKSGVDLDCGDSFKNLEDAVQQELISEKLVDKSLERLFVARLKLGLFDPVESQPYNQIPLDSIDSNEHRETARQAARESLVLLKNEGSFLPLKPSISSMLVTGPHSQSTASLCSNYIGQLPKVVSIADGVMKATPSADIKVEEGCGMTSLNLSKAVSAIEAAKSSQYTVIALGLDQSQETETRDRTTLDLPGYQLDFLKEIAKETSNIILVVIGGGSVDLTWAKSSPSVKAIVYGFYPGEETGTAVADLILGEFSPSGRLPITIYESKYSGQVAITSMGMNDGPGRTYRFYTGNPVYPFGYGLSYTEFSLKWITAPVDGKLKISVENTGRVASDVPILAFFEMSDPQCPRKQLFAIQHVKDLEPGQAQDIEIHYDANGTYCVDTIGNRATPKGPVVIRIGDLTAQVEFTENTGSEERKQALHMNGANVLITKPEPEII